MKKSIVLNLKMNLDYEGAQSYINIIKDRISDGNEIVFLPSLIYLEMFKKSGYKLGAQNVHYADKGAFTGETSPLQLKTMGIHYALVGHSERRIYFKEDDHLINEKVKGSLKNDLKVILCIGETEEERRLRKTALIIEKQIINDLKGVDQDSLGDIIIAYEPVWAIGSGKTPRVEDIEDAIKYTKKITEREYNIIPKVLYGGSVNKENIKAIMNISNLDGILVGTSSFDPNYLVSMLDIID
jgi:triosephosphate isomerase